MRKALVIGINEYAGKNRLSGCVNDANAIAESLKTNGDLSHNFDVKLLLDNDATRKNIMNAVHDLYKNNDDVSLLYFSGHGYDDKDDGALISIDLQKILFKEIVECIDNAHTKNNIIILDCCFSGKLAVDTCIGDKTVLSENTIILTACRPNEPAIESRTTKHGVFTNLLLSALQGGSSDLLGRISPASIYAYIDQALSSWEQRPFFKANVSSFVSLRTVQPKISVEELKKGMKYFDNEDYQYQLDPSYEYTNYRGNKEHKSIKPYAKEKNVKIMQLLQKFNRNGLVLPVDEVFMYDAAMKSKKVHLTELGKHYWRLIDLGRI